MITMWTTNDIQYLILAVLDYNDIPDEIRDRLLADLNKMNDECKPENNRTRIIKTED